MSLEDIAAASAPAPGPETTTQPEAGSDANRYEGFLNLDEKEPVDPANPPVEGEEGTEPVEVDPWADYEDFELDGETHKIPSKLKDGYLRTADYTRKTQEVAETKRQLQAREQELAQVAQRTQEEFQTHVQLEIVNSRLKGTENINWNAEYQKILSDPNLRNDPLLQQEKVNEFNAAYMQWQELRQAQAALIDQNKGFAQKRTEAAQQETAKRLSATRDYAEKNIKGWTPELDTKITEFAIKGLGYDVDMLRNAYNPQVYRTLYLAYVGHQSQNRQQTARPTPQTPPPVATKTVSAKAGAVPSLDPETMSTEDYVKARKAGKFK